MQQKINKNRFQLQDDIIKRCFCLTIGVLWTLWPWTKLSRLKKFLSPSSGHCGPTAHVLANSFLGQSIGISWYHAFIFVSVVYLDPRMMNLQDVWGEDVIHQGYFSMQISLILTSPQFLACHIILQWIPRQENWARVEWTIFRDPPRSVMSEISLFHHSWLLVSDTPLPRV